MRRSALWMGWLQLTCTVFLTGWKSEMAALVLKSSKIAALGINLKGFSSETSLSVTHWNSCWVGPEMKMAFNPFGSPSDWGASSPTCSSTAFSAAGWDGSGIFPPFAGGWPLGCYDSADDYPREHECDWTLTRAHDQKWIPRRRVY